MSVYVDFATDPHGFFFTRTDIYNNDAHRFFWDPSGEIYFTEYETRDPDGTLRVEKRRVNYSAEFDSHSITVNAQAGREYNVENSLILTDGDDTETYGGENDFIFALGGDDSINLGDGHNVVLGDVGSDILTGGAGTDIIFGGDENDTLRGGAHNDYLYGGNGDDLLFGDGRDDLITGGIGNDIMFGGSGNDVMFDTHDHNDFRGNNGDDFIIGGFGNDVAGGDAGDDIIRTGAGNDTLRGGDGNDNLRAEQGDDYLFGHAGNDVLDGGADADHLDGGDGNDFLAGGFGEDYLFGRAGDDRLHADDPQETTGNDHLKGGDGNDMLFAGAGADRLYGEADDDLLAAAAGGQAYMTGGSGADTFAFDGHDGFVHRIQDFTADDFINISDLLTGFDPVSGAIGDFVTLAFQTETRTDLRVNADGQGTDFRQVAVIAADLSGVTAADLYNSGQLVMDQKLFGSDF